jgi:hypothetical protein
MISSREMNWEIGGMSLTGQKTFWKQKIHGRSGSCPGSELDEAWRKQPVLSGNLQSIMMNGIRSAQQSGHSKNQARYPWWPYP